MTKAKSRSRIRRKTPVETPVRPGARGGGKLLTGNPGNRGGGRTPDAFKELCREFASGELTVKQVRTILKSPRHKFFMAALKWASEHGYGKPTQPIDLNVTGTLAMRLERARKRVAQ